MVDYARFNSRVLGSVRSRRREFRDSPARNEKVSTTRIDKPSGSSDNASKPKGDNRT